MVVDRGFRDSILIIVDHANNFIPSKYKNLGLSKNLTESHIAYDLSILNLSKRINVLLESDIVYGCLLYTSPSPRDLSTSRMPSSA